MKVCIITWRNYGRNCHLEEKTNLEFETSKEDKQHCFMIYRVISRVGIEGGWPTVKETFYHKYKNVLEYVLKNNILQIHVNTMN